MSNYGLKLLSVLIALLVCLLLCQNAAAQSDAVSAILASMPRGSDAVRGNWLFIQAKMLPDAEAAYELMTIIASDYGGEAAAQARLWKIRYHLAGQETAAATEEVRRLPPENAAISSVAESRYWRTLLGEDTAPDPSARETGIPPWTVMSHLAAVPTSDLSGRDVRRVLALDGVVRRWGLLGPWLWRLVRTEQPQLKIQVREYLVTSNQDLQYDPSLPAITALLDRRNWIEAAPVTEEPVFEPTPLPTPFPESVAEPEAAFAEAKPGLYAIQVGAFLNETAAKALVRELGSHGFSAYCRQPDEIDLLHRVRIGPVPSAAAAESLGQRLSEVLMLPYQLVEE